mmetsp:Transcript_10664/g.17403  ORF Transcript_10664/g.17403 Transcript_10664/m.17403 type:complete len:245 (-) Transcript_10664:34-768(-)|eukprot:CAMPEP_0203784568 /NCGR_PEP_ID=MMETSP0100_2-20121128/533_1 /ASSEMBLY_ACC=CAM_ASM_000210 /TAXON_ID=96639 /ORGANISM=" , Strain NY0313808BC1" /LENGTH=244 /DNA_ID=CAMNT_0050686553 /DNA_START=1825 /DNA_END=2559 /DNA_ORIENTATION=-
MRRIAVLFQGEGSGLGDVGKHVVNQALKEDGLTVRIIAEDPQDVVNVASVTPIDISDEDRETKLELRAVCIDKETAELEEALDGVDAVVNCFGNRQPGMPRLMGVGAANIVQAMQKQDIKRLVTISSVGAGDSFPPMPWSWYGTLFSCLMRTIIKSARKDLDLLESAVENSELDFLIVRPTGVTPTFKPTGTWKLMKANTAETVGPEIAKEDVAKFMLREALQPSFHREAWIIGANNSKDAINN